MHFRKLVTSAFSVLVNSSRNNSTNMTSRLSPSLQSVVQVLENFAPLKFAESWDNVGLLIAPYTPKEIQTIFLTNDLTEPVLLEAVEQKADLIISYHPPIFAPLKRITQDAWKERIVSCCLENRISLYSPHTAWDVTKNGVNDWLAGAFAHKQNLPIKPIPDCAGGVGRKIDLTQSTTIRDAIEKVKGHTGIQNVHVALGNSHSLDDKIETVALCAGSGASVLKGVEADLYLTGEMSHHDLLDAQHNNISVILCNHSNSERGFLKAFKETFSRECESTLNRKVNVIVSTKDADPLLTY